MGYRYVWQGGGEGATMTLVEDPDYDPTGNPLPKTVTPKTDTPTTTTKVDTTKVDVSGITDFTPKIPDLSVPTPTLTKPTATDVTNVPTLLNIDTPTIQNSTKVATSTIDTSAFNDIAKAIHDQTTSALEQMKNLADAASVKAPTVLAPTTMPTLGDQASRDASRKSISDALARTGRATSILTQAPPGG